MLTFAWPRIPDSRNGGLGGPHDDGAQAKALLQIEEQKPKPSGKTLAQAAERYLASKAWVAQSSGHAARIN